MITLLLALMLLLPLPAVGEGDVSITELMARNGVYENGQAHDWLEITNSGAQAVSLSGWGISDDASAPFAFVFPDNTTLKPGAQALVWCVGKAGPPVKGAHNAPFKLSGEGETLYLTRPDGSQAQALAFPEQYGNTAWGLAGGMYGFLEQATPGKPNPDTAFASRADTPQLTSGQFFEGALTVTLMAAPGSDIRYTLDGSTPARTDKAYTQPLLVDKTTVLRARVYMDGLLPSAEVAATYIKEPPPDYPVVSLIADKKHLFDEKIGALSKGSGSTPNYEKEREYPAFVEYFARGGALQVSQQGTFTASGHSARVNKQKSIALYARAAYGPDRFSYNPFPNRTYQSYKSWLLRAANSDAYATRLRDPAISSLAKGTGLLYQDGVPITVYINGEYWGHYNLREKINKHFVAQWEGVTKDKHIDAIDILARTGTDEFVQNGSNEDWLALMDFCRDHDLNNPDNLLYVTERLDVDSLFQHTLFEMIIGNTDMTNVRMYRVPGGKWKYLLFDVEASFMSTKETPISWYIKPKTAKRARFQHVHLAALLEVPAMREKFLLMAADMIETRFTWPNVEAHFAPWEQALQDLLPRHAARWRNITMDSWRKDINAVKHYARVRPARVIDHLCKYMKVTKEERARIFGRVEALLEQTNAK
jgi:hypothetical protein